MGNLQSSLDKLKEALGIVRPSEELAKAAETFVADNAAYLESETKETEEWVWVEGYKGTDKNMKAYGNFQYELGKQYDYEGEIQICANGFHFSRDLKAFF